jgi:cytochrome bd-type quinol oxidase subunit 2
MLSFAMDASAFSSRISLLIGSLFATVVNMRASESILGRTDTFGLTDQIHLLVAFFIFVSAATALITKGMEAKRARRIDRWTALVSFVTFVLANAVLIGSGFIG